MSTSLKKNRQARANARQIMAMVEYIEQHPHIQNHKFVGLHGKENIDGSWEDMANYLNSLATDGRTKDVKSWKTTWRDFKTKVSEKMKKIRKNHCETGNKFVDVTLTELDKRILGLLGTDCDAGYPLEPWLLTPLPHYPDWSRQFQYNEQLCKARSIVERFFGVLEGRWRCLSYQRVLMYDPGVAGKMVNACCILHNMALHYRLPLPPDIVDCGEDFGAICPHVDADNLNIDERIRGPRAITERIKRQIMQERFPNFVCAWENN